MERFLHLLAPFDIVFSQWFQQGWTLEEALAARFEARETDILKEFREQSQEEGRLVDEGFSLGLWNGQDNDAGSSMHVTCGTGTTQFPNACTLYPPDQGEAAARVFQPSVLAQVLRAMAVAWEPEWGVATSHELRDALMDSNKANLFIGWLTYFSHRRGPLPPLPPPVRVEPVDGLGSLVLLTPERPSLSHPAHLELARDVTHRLSRAGLLTPLRPHHA